MAVRVRQEVQLGALWYSVRLFATYGLLSYILYIQETYRPPLPSKKTSERERYTMTMMMLFYGERTKYRFINQNITSHL
jgi:hypothetical protein